MTTHGFTVSHARDAGFERGLRSFFEYRDLGVKRCTDGHVVAHVIRAVPGADGRLDIEKTLMSAYLQSTWVKVGIGLLIVGAGPLLFIIAAAAFGLWPDPNPNPIGPGLLFFLTFWPAIICIVVGVIRVRIGNRRAG